MAADAATDGGGRVCNLPCSASSATEAVAATENDASNPRERARHPNHLKCIIALSGEHVAFEGMFDPEREFGLFKDTPFHQIQQRHVYWVESVHPPRLRRDGDLPLRSEGRIVAMFMGEGNARIADMATTANEAASANGEVSLVLGAGPARLPDIQEKGGVDLDGMSLPSTPATPSPR